MGLSRDKKQGRAGFLEASKDMTDAKGTWAQELAWGRIFQAGIGWRDFMQETCWLGHAEG